MNNWLLRSRKLLALLALVSCAPSDNARDAQTAPSSAPEGMVWIPGGTFSMGDDGPFALPHEQPVHRVRLSGFYMSVHTVTNEEYARFVDATQYVTVAERTPSLDELMRGLPPGTPAPKADLLVPGSLVFTPAAGEVDLRDVNRWWSWVPGANWRRPQGPESDLTGKERHPVVHIAWEDAVAYTQWVGGRLPTEAEWEYAARGGLESKPHAWGDAAHDSAHPQAHIYNGTFPLHPAAAVAVGSYPPNGYGLHDMSGNVWQWTADWYAPDTYTRHAAAGVPRDPSENQVDARATSSAQRVIRGGSFLCSDVYCRGYRVSARGTGAPDTGASHIGFRVLLTVAQRQALP